MDRCHELELRVVELERDKHESPKKTVTKKWVWDRVDKEIKECGHEDSPARPASYEIKGMIVDILTELGVVEEI